jgi:hypothetical protein
MPNYISSKEIMDNLLQISPKYLSDIDTNRTSTFGYLVEALTNSIEDGINLVAIRSSDNIIELSNDIEKIKAVSKIRNVLPQMAKPAVIDCVLSIRHEDILATGDKQGLNYSFIIDEKSTLNVNDVMFSLKNPVVIRAVYNSGKYIYTANYLNSDGTDVIHIFDTTLQDGEKRLALIVQMIQYEYKVETRTIVDISQFTYEGLRFEHKNLADFDVYHKKPNSDLFEKMNKMYYRFNDATKKTLLYDDDREEALYILNAPSSGVLENSEIRVVFKETMGKDGNFDSVALTTSFKIYSDENYKFAGVDIVAEVVSEARGGENGETKEDLVKRLIIDKQSRRVIVTDLDIKNYVPNSKDIVVIKKRSDFQFRLFNIYTLLRNGIDIVPAITRNIKLYDTDFNLIHPTSGTRVVLANNKYTLEQDVTDGPFIMDNDILPENYLDYEYNTSKLLTLCPFAFNINSDMILSYYLNSIHETVPTRTTHTNDNHPYQFIVRDVVIKRDAYDEDNYNFYDIEVHGILNTEDTLGMIDDKGVVINDGICKVYIIFSNGANKNSYLPLYLDNLNPDTRIYTFKGSFQTNDYVTAEGRLQVTGGLYGAGTNDALDDVINYKDSTFEVATFFDTPAVSKSHVVYTVIPEEGTLSTIAENSVPYNLLVELNKYIRSSIRIEEEDDGEGGTRNAYILNEVPVIRYTYARENSAAIAKQLLSIDKYKEIVSRLAEHTINLKLISTYGPSRYVQVSDDTPLNNLNPVLKFKIYGRNVNVPKIKERIRAYFSDFSAETRYIFISNINTIIETEFGVTSVEYLGVDNFDSSFQKFKNEKPDLTDKAIALAYVPEFLNITDIYIELVENF